MSSQRVTVIGGLGFLGSRIAESLCAAGHTVRVFDRLESDSARSQVARWGAELVSGDLANDADVRLAISDADSVFHCAYATVPRTAAENPSHDLSANVLCLLRFLEALCAQGSCRRIVYLSSGGTVYGRQLAESIDETHPTEPISAYGVSKLVCEKYLQLYRARYGLGVTILRPSNPYGPGQRVGTPQGVVGHFLDRIARSRPIEVWGDGTVVRDYFYVEDLRELAPRVLSSDRADGIFNVGSGQGRSLNEVIDTIRAVVDVPVQVSHIPAQPYDTPINVLDVRKAREVFGWGVKTDFADGVARTWEQIAQVHRTGGRK